MRNRLLYIIIGVTTSLALMAQPRFRTAELQRLATAVQLNADSLGEGYSHPMGKGQRLTVHVSGKTIDHIGLRLFADELRSASSLPILDFLERYFLQLKYPPTVKTASLMIRDDEFRFLTGSLATVDNLMTDDSFSYESDQHRYTATWTRNGVTLLSVSFPVEYELISGENKIEAEDNLKADVLHTKNTIPVDSLANFGNYQLHVTQLSYGFRKATFDVPFSQWAAFCLSRGCELQYGIEEEAPNGDVKMVVLAVNTKENYNHVMSIVIPAEAIRTKRGIVEARLYPYIPTHNIGNMFASFRKSNPKVISSR